MIWLYRFLRGYVMLKFSGDFAEQILNLCVSHRISIWNSRLCKGGIETSIYAKDFKKLRKIVRKSRVRVKIIKKSGLPFKLSKNKKRAGLFLGAVLFIAFLEIMSGFIWSIEITGNSRVKTEEILKTCRQIGIYEGVRADSINAKTSREKLLLNSKGLAWASLNVEGSCLTVNVTEISDAKKDKATPCNLKASADGIIKKIDVSVGNCVVKVGDTVKKGDVLVSGILEKADNTKFVHSAGVISAESRRVFECEGRFKKTVKEKNGKQKTKFVLEFLNVKVPLFLGSETGDYATELEIKQAELFGKKLPLRLYERKFFFCDETVLYLSEEQLTEELKRKIEKQIESLNLKDYTVSDFKSEKTKDGIILSAEVKAIENIAVEDEILINYEN